jgi:F0F1-type ATP synthase delta subunit
MTLSLIAQFLLLTAFVSGAIIFILHRVFITSVDGAKQRLERDAEAARAREAELNRKIKQADEELSERKKALDQLERKMKVQLEEEAIKNKEELANKARAEAEDIIVKAQSAAEGIRREIERQMEIKIIDHARQILQDILSDKAKNAFERDLVEEFIVQLQGVDMSKISPDITSAEVVTACPVSDSDFKKINEIVKSRAGRQIALTARISDEFIAGVVLKFGSLHLDGSIRNAIRESVVAMKGCIDKTGSGN